MPMRPPGVRDSHHEVLLRHRESACRRGYDRTWRRFRARILFMRPTCEDCAKRGRIELAREVHHIIALRDGGERLDERNALALCTPCHSVRTRAGE